MARINISYNKILIKKEYQLPDKEAKWTLIFAKLWQPLIVQLDVVSYVKSSTSWIFNQFSKQLQG